MGSTAGGKAGGSSSELETGRLEAGPHNIRGEDEGLKATIGDGTEEGSWAGTLETQETLSWA